jgi:hypothetical protein
MAARLAGWLPTGNEGYSFFSGTTFALSYQLADHSLLNRNRMLLYATNFLPHTGSYTNSLIFFNKFVDLNFIIY